MKICSRDQRLLIKKKGGAAREGSMAVRAAERDIPLATLKTRIKKLVDKGMERERAIEVALVRPIGPQGRPRRS